MNICNKMTYGIKYQSSNDLSGDFCTFQMKWKRQCKRMPLYVSTCHMNPTYRLRQWVTIHMFLACARVPFVSAPDARTHAFLQVMQLLFLKNILFFSLLFFFSSGRPHEKKNSMRTRDENGTKISENSGYHFQFVPTVSIGIGTCRYRKWKR